MNNQANILKVVSVFAMDNRVKVIRYLNMTGYAQLNANSSLKDINSAIADNMFDDQFWLNFVFKLGNDGSRNSSHNNNINTLYVS